MHFSIANVIKKNTTQFIQQYHAIQISFKLHKNIFSCISLPLGNTFNDVIVVSSIQVKLYRGMCKHKYLGDNHNLLHIKCI